ncbi:hypothetical protein FB107DRAFT_275246 [Schizophyllum commune]
MQFSFTRFFVVLSAVFTMVAATESMKIPENKNATMNVQKMQKNPTVHQDGAQGGDACIWTLGVSLLHVVHDAILEGSNEVICV